MEHQTQVAGSVNWVLDRLWKNDVRFAAGRILSAALGLSKGSAE